MLWTTVSIAAHAVTDVNNRRQRLMKTSRLIAGLLAAGLLVAACGDDSTSSGGYDACRREPTTASR